MEHYAVKAYVGVKIQLRTFLDSTVEVKVKFTLEQVTKAQRGSRGIAVLSL
jgi:hypothetical protein